MMLYIAFVVSLIVLSTTGCPDNSARTVRRGQFGVGQFGATYNINFIENPAFTQRYLFVNPASISAIFFINLASISAISFSSIPFYFSNILLSNPASISAVVFINRASISARFFHQFITVTHNILYQMGLLIEYTKLYTVIHYNQIIQCIFEDR